MPANSCCVVCVHAWAQIHSASVGELVSEARLTVSSSSGSDTDSTEPERQSQGMTWHGMVLAASTVL